MTNASENVAFLGMGTMGGYMAANMARAGLCVTVWNRTPGRPGERIALGAGATRADSIEAAARQARVVFTCVADAPEVHQILLGRDGVASAAEPGALVIDASTIGPRAARSVAADLERLGLSFLDAPVSGGDSGAKAGTLTVMVGGSEDDFRRALPYLSTIGTNVRLCGPVGSGQAVKLVNQLLCAVHTVAMAEALAFAEALGLDPRFVVEICQTGAAGSWSLTNLGPRAANRDFAPGFMIKHIVKDLAHALEAAGSLDFPALRLASTQFCKAKDLDGGSAASQGTQAVIRVYARK